MVVSENENDHRTLSLFAQPIFVSDLLVPTWKMFILRNGGLTSKILAIYPKKWFAVITIAFLQIYIIRVKLDL